MKARFTIQLAAAALVLAASGCAVGNFITGAPSATEGTAAHAGSPARSVAPARQLLVRRCAGCHALPEPATMSAIAWQASLERMKLRMRLPASEWDSLAAMRTQ